MPPAGAPRTVLGIVDGLHDAGAAIVVDGRIVTAANEERFTRVKLQGGMPTRSIHAVLATAELTVADIDLIAVGGLATPTVATRVFRPLQRMYANNLGICFDRPWHPVDRIGDLVRYRLPFTRARSDRGGRLEARLAEPAVRRRLPRGLRGLPMRFVDHHLAHAESAWRTSGDGTWLVITADAHGDGRSLTAWHAPAGASSLTLLHDTGVDASLGAFYSYVTKALGFRPGRHEGKVLGLSARGDVSVVDRPFPFRWEADRLVYEGTWGLRGSRAVKALTVHGREHVAAWLQAGTEQTLMALVERLLAQTGATQVAVAGGVFANVRVNGLIAAHPQVERLHVFPHMGDGGLAAGAALHVQGRAPRPLGPATLGPDLDPAATEAAAAQSGMQVSTPADPDAELADALAAGRCAVRCVGPLEFGPRALGHRSVLAPAEDPAITDRLNAALKRDDFMPFAPILRAEDADAAFAHIGACRDAVRYMTVALPASESFRSACPAAVHVDGTARPQVVHAPESPALHALLTRYAGQTGRPAVINTSFNLHEEPIVATAADAVRAFAASGLPVMRLGRFVLRR